MLRFEFVELLSGFILDMNELRFVPRIEEAQPRHGGWHWCGHCREQPVRGRKETAAMAANAATFPSSLQFSDFTESLVATLTRTLSLAPLECLHAVLSKGQCYFNQLSTETKEPGF